MQAATALHRERYPEARVVFLAGSIVRGEGTAHSDLDLVVVFARLDHAFRESFRWDGWPVEAFVHDAATLRYFFTEVDGPTGAVPLANMVREGLEVPASTAFSRALKDEARAVIDRGPAPWSEPDLRTRRYAITDLIDDLREPRSAAELVGAGARLHELLAEFYLRAGGRWSARGKAIPRRLHEADPTYAARFAEAFEDLLARLDPGPVLRLAEETLRPYGGLLFEGHRLDAPPSWRRDGPGSTG